MKTLACILMVAFVSPLAMGQAYIAVPDLPELMGMPPVKLTTAGGLVRSADQWNNEQRPYLKRLFELYVYGVAPPPARVIGTLDQQNDDVFGGKAVLKQLTLSFPELPENAPRIHLALFLPKGKTPAPVFLALNKCGNYTVTDYAGVTFYPEAWRSEKCPPGESRGTENDFWAIETMIERGYGFATFYDGDIDPDRNDFTDGIHPFFPGLPGPPETHWGTIAAWAWGLQRCMDYLETDVDVDSRAVCVTGHSRRGKTALLAGAFDERFRIVIPLQSGTGGMALSRKNDQETVERINTSFPHWFNNAFPLFANHEAKLPVDQHMLIALVAPRPLLDVAGLQDLWANYESALRAMKLANPAYELLGERGLAGAGVVTGDEPIDGPVFGTMMQYRRDTPHTMNADYWKKIMDFTDLHLGRTKPTPPNAGAAPPSQPR